MKKFNIKDKIIVIIFIILCLTIGCFFINNYLKEEISNYELYADYTMASKAMTLSFNKSFDLQYMTLRNEMSISKGKKYSKGELIYDFAQHHFIPILNYLKEVEENENLYDSFGLILQFIEDFNLANYKDREKIIVPQSEDLYYIKENNIYKYKIRIKYINLDEFNRLYNEYIQDVNIDDYFINKLYQYLKRDYTYNDLKKEVTNNYEKIYKEYKDIIIQILSKDLEKFDEYLLDNYLYIPLDEEGNRIGFPSIIKEINTSEKVIYYNFKRKGRIYNSVSKYYRYEYELNFEDIYNQLKEYNLPLLYM